MRESITGNVKLADTNAEVFKSLLKFIYTGEIKLDLERATEMVEMAAFLQVKSLQKICEEYLIPLISDENCVKLWKTADLNNCELLRRESLGKILTNFPSISTTTEYYDLDIEELVKIISQEDLYIANEEDLCKSLFKWVDKDEGREFSFDEVLEHIRLPLLRPEFLMKLENIPYVKNNERCMEFISEAKNYQLLPARQHEFENARTHARSMSDLEEVVVVLGGCESTKPPYTRSRSAYCYSFRQKKWFEIAPLPYDPGIEFASVTYHNDIYISGGGMMQLSFLWYEISKNEWHRLEPMIRGRRRHASLAVYDAVYILGGYDSDRKHGEQMLDNVEKYVISEARWEEAGHLATAVSCFTVIILDDKIYTFGGEKNNRVDTALIQCYDITTQQTSKLSARIPMACKLTRSCVINDRIFLIFYDGRVIEFFKESDKQDEEGPICRTVGRFDAFQRTHFGVVQHRGNVIIVGGVIENTKPCSDILMFNTETKECSTLDDTMFTARLVDGCVKILVPKKHLVPLADDEYEVSQC
ncbi:hypothetical protein FSP39_019136 [Pinctada imbricata]|uniref:BTB domain-containing protein n=1 Tax=Pinctada imbricata TaxID=66713 RepID=A0AA88XG69_PINIB|nr:hypothetical protein FSP39_019136 [Pinctada imbricata]